MTPGEINHLYPNRQNVGKFRVINDIDAERNYQDRKYGGVQNDDRNTGQDWIVFIQKYTDKASDAYDADDDAEYRKQLVKVAALAVAAIESFDRKANGTKPTESV